MSRRSAQNLSVLQLVKWQGSIISLLLTASPAPFGELA